MTRNPWKSFGWNLISLTNSSITFIGQISDHYAQILKFDFFFSFSQSYSKTDIDERTQGHTVHKSNHGTNSCVTTAPGGTLLPDFPKPSKLTLPEDVSQEKVRECVGLILLRIPISLKFSTLWSDFLRLILRNLREESLLIVGGGGIAK